MVSAEPGTVQPGQQEGRPGLGGRPQEGRGRTEVEGHPIRQPKKASRRPWAAHHVRPDLGPPACLKQHRAVGQPPNLPGKEELRDPEGVAWN